MFACLCADAFVGCDYEQNRIDAANTRKHVPHEVAMPGHVDDTDRFPSRQHHGSKTKIDRHLTGDLFLEAIRIGAGQCGDQG